MSESGSYANDSTGYRESPGAITSHDEDTKKLVALAVAIFDGLGETRRPPPERFPPWLRALVVGVCILSLLCNLLLGWYVQTRLDLILVYWDDVEKTVHEFKQELDHGRGSVRQEVQELRSPGSDAEAADDR